MNSIIMNRIAFTILMVLGLFSCQTNTAQDGSVAQTVSTADFINLLEAKSDIQLIDVRTPGEFNNGHIKNAENIDVNDRKFEVEAAALDKTKPTFVYCKSGGRSARAMASLANMGFTEVYNLKGGIMAWEAANQPTEGQQKMSVTKGMSVEQFNQLVTSDKTVLVDFSATWCGPCKLLKPIIKQVEKENKETLQVIYLDVDEQKELSNALGIQSIPLLHVYKNGKLVDKSLGLIDKRAVKKLIK